MWHLYLDESGDLGFDFANRKSSSFLTITVLATSSRETVDRLRTAMRRTLRNKVNRKRKNDTELKGSSSTLEIKRYFYRQVEDCAFGLYAVTLDKRQLLSSMKEELASKSRLYNYLARQVLEKIPLESAEDVVELIVDKSKGSWEAAEFNDYVRSHLEGRISPLVALKIYHHDSTASAGLSAVDLFCWGIFRKHERQDEEWYSVYREKVVEDARCP